MSIKCFISSSSGFRGIATIFRTLKEWVSSLGSPHFTTVRQWLLKIGLFQLKAPKYSPQGWYFIIDTSIQMGPQKCVVVLGLQKHDIQQNFCPTLEDVESLVVKPLCTSPGEVIFEILEEATKVVGEAPCAVISDAGAELKKGVRLYSEKHTETIHLFDISHKINDCLKKELENDRVWLAFKSAATASIQHLKLSSIAYLAPPKQRTKSRMHSSFYLIEWGLRTIEFLNSPQGKSLTTDELSKIKWLQEYRFSLPSYIQFKAICEKGLNLVHEKGYYVGGASEFEILTCDLTDLRSIQFRDKVKKLISDEEQKIPSNIHYQGSSEIIESLFGKFKSIEKNYSSSGLTTLVLAIPALVGKVDETLIIKAMKAISLNDVIEWYNTNMGKTYLSKRRWALNECTENNKENNLELCDLFT